MKRAMQSMCRPVNNERGQSLAFVGIGIGTAAFLFLAVVAIDIGRLAFTATEVQTVADSTAIAGAIALLKGTDVTTAANTVAGCGGSCPPGNQVEGTTAVVPCSGGGPCADVTIGTLDSTTWRNGGCTATSLDPCFSPGGASPNAVKSTAQATVNNVLASMLGSSTSTVTKTAVGAIGGLGGQQPTLPLAICKECFAGDCTGSGCVTLTQTPSGTDTTAWTGFFDGTGTSDIAAFLPSPCGNGGATIPRLSTGDTINLNNGQQSQSQILQAIQCMVCPPNDVPSFVIPVIECSGACGAAQLNQSSTVVGFTTIVVQSFNYSSQNSTPNLCGPSQGALKSMNLSEIKNTDLSGPPSGGLFGTLVAGMVG
jgi:hypothetical protein